MPLPVEPIPLPPTSPPHGGTPPRTPTPDFTDADLAAALAPLLQPTPTAPLSPSPPPTTRLEPLLRTTIRRAIAEASPTASIFQPPGFLDRLLWHLQAVFTSRSYHDILFEKTHRFKVHEVFLLDPHTLALISYASADPARHASAHRVAPTVQHFAANLRDPDGTPYPVIDLPEHRQLLTLTGASTLLLALIRGRTNDLITDDLAYFLHRVEHLFADRLATPGQPLLRELQPFLEDCLLIQAPESAI